MFDTHERILQRLHDSGHKEFSVEMIRGIIDTVETEEIDRMYDEWRRETDPHTNRDYEPVSWEDATEDLDRFPELADHRDMEMEM
jgi:hypothetical protein